MMRLQIGGDVRIAYHSTGRGGGAVRDKWPTAALGLDGERGILLEEKSTLHLYYITINILVTCQ